MRSEEWTRKAKLKRVLIKDGAGPVVFCENGNIYVNTGEGHVMWLGVSGAGKSRRGLIPFAMSVIKNQQSGVFIDPKGEIYQYTKDMISCLYDLHVIDFRKLFEKSAEGWNPLSGAYKLWKSGSPKDKHEAGQLIEELAFAMFPNSVHADAFWINEARALFIGVVYALFSYAKPEQINLASCYYMIAEGEERYGACSYIKEFVKIVAKNESVAMQLESYVTTASDTAGGIRSVYLDGLSQYARSEFVRDFLSHDELRIDELKGDRPTLVYIILPDETKIFDHIAATLCSQMMNHYIRIAEQDYNGKLPVRINFLLDELGNIGGALKDSLPHLLTAGRSRNIRCGLALQSLSQLQAVFGAENAQTIISNCDVRITYRVNDYNTLSELSKLLGEKEINCDGHVSREPLATPSQLSAFTTGQCLVMISGRLKFITTLPDFTEMNISHYRPEKTAVVTRRKIGEFSFFDIKDFVKRAKTEEMNEKNSFSIHGFLQTDNTVDKKENAERKKCVYGDDQLLDELIKNIDRQIAELEEEERKEKKAKKDKKERKVSKEDEKT